jgi:hypothetical protein
LSERVLWLSALAVVSLIALVAAIWALRPVPIPHPELAGEGARAMRPMFNPLRDVPVRF